MEQRQEPRVQAAYQIMYECFRHDAKVSEGAAHTVNLSERGALIELTQEVALDASMILWIFAPFYTLLVKGDVVHAQRRANGLFRVGVKLTDVIEGNWDVLK
ncbi:MAG: PilZ domain-containing protein [Anaerolineales bacterium]|nr:PilZ domain-containing protein [Anaerolineales bacterium]